MLVTDRERLKEEIHAWADQYGHSRTALMPILQEVQARYRHCSEYAMQEIADLVGIHPVEVHGVVSFYSFLTTEPQGKFVVRVCQTMSCDMAGKDRVALQLVNDLDIDFGETTPDGMFTLEWASCIGMCDQGPALLINDKVYSKVTPNQVHDIIEECRATYGVHALQKEGH
mgnify:CR=1 FL=1